jgi:Activator of Hsp90 ATPase homolog 1-like protein
MVIRWQNQAKPELEAEGESRCTMELGPFGAAVKLSITHSIEREPSKLIEAVSGGWPKVISNLKSMLETGSIALREPYPIESAHSAKGVAIGHSRDTTHRFQFHGARVCVRSGCTVQLFDKRS